MKEKMTGMQWVEKKGWVWYKVLPIAALLYALSLPQEWSAKGLSGTDEETPVMEITPQVQDKKDDIIGWKTAIQWISVKDSDEWVTSWDDEIEPWITGWDGDDEEIKEKSESSASFSRQTGVWYSVTGWEALWVNRFVWSGKLFKGKLWEISVIWIADVDDPLHTKWSWKLILWKSLYKGLSLDWDYTFTGTWDNVFGVGMWYGGQLWDGSYTVKLFPLNTNWSPISAKVSFSTKVWKSWSLSSFVFVDFDTKWYYSETEYIHQLAQWVAAFVQARLMWTVDGKFTGADGQILMWWLQIDL